MCPGLAMNSGTRVEIGMGTPLSVGKRGYRWESMACRRLEDNEVFSDILELLSGEDAKKADVLKSPVGGIGRQIKFSDPRWPIMLQIKPSLREWSETRLIGIKYFLLRKWRICGHKRSCRGIDVCGIQQDIVGHWRLPSWTSFCNYSEHSGNYCQELGKWVWIFPEWVSNVNWECHAEVLNAPFFCQNELFDKIEALSLFP